MNSLQQYKCIALLNLLYNNKFAHIINVADVVLFQIIWWNWVMKVSISKQRNIITVIGILSRLDNKNKVHYAK
jgi:hypothetical protein